MYATLLGLPGHVQYATYSDLYSLVTAMNVTDGSRVCVFVDD